MDFHLGFLDKWFGKKIEFRLNDKHGNPIIRKVSERWFHAVMANGSISKTDEVHVQILDPLHGLRKTIWIIGKDIDQQTVDKFRDDETNHIFAIAHYEQGEAKTNILKKTLWDEAKAKMSL